MGTSHTDTETDGVFEPVQRAPGGSTPDGVFVTVSRGQEGHRRVYVSAEARRRLGKPDYLKFLVNETRERVAIAPGDPDEDPADDYLYKLNTSSWHVAFERPLQELDADVEGRLYAEEWTDDGWMVVSL